MKLHKSKWIPWHQNDTEGVASSDKRKKGGEIEAEMDAEMETEMEKAAATLRVFLRRGDHEVSFLIHLGVSTFFFFFSLPLYFILAAASCSRSLVFVFPSLWHHDFSTSLSLHFDFPLPLSLIWIVLLLFLAFTCDIGVLNLDVTFTTLWSLLPLSTVFWRFSLLTTSLALFPLILFFWLTWLLRFHNWHCSTQLSLCPLSQNLNENAVSWISIMNWFTDYVWRALPCVRWLSFCDVKHNSIYQINLKLFLRLASIASRTLISFSWRKTHLNFQINI